MSAAGLLRRQPGRLHASPRHALLMIWLALLLSPALAAAPAQLPAQTVLQLDGANGADVRSHLLPWMSYWIEHDPEPAPDHPPAAVLNSARFQPATALALTPGYTASALWVRLHLHNPQPQPLRRVLLLEPARLESVNLYWHDAQGRGWQHSLSGTDLPFEARALPLRDHAFMLELAPGEQRTLLLRVSSRSALALQPSLWHEDALLRKQQSLLWLDGLLHSLGVVVGLIALLLGISQRSAGYTLLGLYLACATLFEASMRGTSFMLLWPHATDWAQRALGSLGLLTTLLQALSIRLLLLLPQKQPGLNRLLLLLVGCNLALTGLCILGDYRLATQLANLGNTGLMLTGLLASARAARAGQFLGRIWLLVVLSQLLSQLPRQLSLLGHIPINTMIDYAGNLVSAASGLLVIISIARRIADERRDRARQLQLAVEQRTAELAAAHAELRASDAAKGRLLGHIGHDLRAPLASMLQLSRRLAPGADFESNRRAIEQSSLLLLDSIDELQGFARKPEGGVNAEVLPAPLYLHGLLRDAAEQAQAMVRSQRNQLHLQLGADLPGVLALDARRLRQVLFNLLSNAAKHGARGGDIWLTADVVQGQLQISVRDQGPGIDAAEQSRVFEPFHRGAQSAGLPGLGLGLSIARQTARAMGGDLSLHSQAGQGCRFTLSLPLQLAEESQVQWPPLMADSLPPLGEGWGAVVLDDCITASEALRERLLVAGFDVEAASTLDAVEPALAALAAHGVPRLLVYEPALLASPGMQEALASLQRRWPDVLTLACAAKPDSEQILAKPASDTLLWTALRERFATAQPSA